MKVLQYYCWLYGGWQNGLSTLRGTDSAYSNIHIASFSDIGITIRVHCGGAFAFCGKAEVYQDGNEALGGCWIWILEKEAKKALHKAYTPGRKNTFTAYEIKCIGTVRQYG